MNIKSIKTSLITATFIFGFAGVSKAALTITITDLGTLGGADSFAYGINASGQVVGNSATAGGVETAFIYTNGTMASLGTLGLASSYATGINSGGQVVGWAQTAGGTSQAFLYTGGAMTTAPFSTLGGNSGAIAINDSGQIADAAVIGSPAYTRTFLYSGGAQTLLPTFGGSFSTPDAINNAGQVVGTASTTDAGGGINQAFLYSNGTMTDLGTLGGAMSVGTGINSGGQIVGLAEPAGDNSNSSWVGSHAFLYTAGGMTDLGTLGGSTSYALGINDSGQVVGWSYTAGGTSDAFYWANGVMTDLNSLLAAGSGWQLEQATAINNSGQVVGYGIAPNGQTHAFLLDTSSTPEPATLALVGIGAALLLVRRRSEKRAEP